MNRQKTHFEFSPNIRIMQVFLLSLVLNQVNQSRSAQNEAMWNIGDEPEPGFVSLFLGSDSY